MGFNSAFKGLNDDYYSKEQDFFVSLQPNSNLGHLIVDVSRSHTIRFTYTHTYTNTVAIL